MPLHLLDHPLAAHIVTHLRDRKTKAATFRTLCYQLSLLLAIEATRGLASEARSVETPLEPTEGRVLGAEPMVIVPVLRSGLGMAQPFLDLFPHVSVGYVGLERDHETAQPREYYSKLPELRGRRVFVVDPMLATGGSAVKALAMVRGQGASNPTLLSIFVAPEGLAEVERHHPGLAIYAAALDRELSAQKYILPGVGDFGDRLFGT
jgi:uracil phosphoribosyltransferase